MTSEKQVTIPEGYKQTEVGMKNSSGTNFNDACGGPKGGGMDSRRVPEDWNTKNIGSYLTIRHGRDQKQVQCEDGMYPILGTGGEMGRSDTFIYDKPSVLIGRKGSINKPRFMDSPFWTVDTLFYSEVDDKNSAKFLFYKFCMIDWMGHNEASGVPSLNASTIEGVSISCPIDLKEQTAIANALSDVDNLIAALETLIAKKSAIKTAAMQQLLTGKKRLPGFGNQGDSHLTGSRSMADTTHIKDTDQTGIRIGYKQTELGEIPEDWEVLPLSELCSLKSGATITSASFEDGAKYPCYGGNGLRGYTKTFNYEGEFALIGRQGALCGNIQYVNEVFFASEHALVATASKITDVKWLAIYLKRMNLNQYSESSAQPGLSAIKLSVLKLIAPKKEEQTAIATVLSDMDTELDALQQRLSKTKTIKQGMMQELLTGKTRLPFASDAKASS